VPKRGRVYINQSVSFPPELLEMAKERARRLGLSFSTYVQKCIETDLKERKALVFAEREEPARAAAEEAGPVADSPKSRQARKP
jgi:predicted DNA-binding protein